MTAAHDGGIEAVFSPDAQIRQMLRFEAALARAEASLEVIPAEAAERIAVHCVAERFDVQALLLEAETAGTIALPLVRALTENVGDEFGRYVHWGATSQDTMDTALVLQMRDGIGVIIADLLRAADRCAELAVEHRKTVMAGRTLLQQAVPITFGLKAARWVALLMRRMQKLDDDAAQYLVLQFGGAAGTLASLGSSGPAVAERLGGELELPVPPLPWHTERDRTASTAAGLGVTAGAVSKIAGDIVLLAQTEVGEVGDDGATPTKGGSSAMPNKRNPTDAIAAIASARMVIGMIPVCLSAMGAEHERGAGSWRAESMAIAEIFRHSARAVRSVAGALTGLRVNASRMGENVTLGGGAIMAESLSMALATHIGRPAAQQRVRDLLVRARADGTTLRDGALADVGVAHLLSRDVVESALAPENYLGANDVFIDRALAEYKVVRAELASR